MQLVIAANDGYLPGKTNFACRVARCFLTRSQSARATKASAGNPDVFAAFKKASPVTDAPPSADDPVDISIPAVLKEYGSREPGLLEEMGEDFARGHAHASGGIVTHDAFERLWAVINAGDGSGKGKAGKNGKGVPGQKGTLDKWMKAR